MQRFWLLLLAFLLAACNKVVVVPPTDDASLSRRQLDETPNVPDDGVVQFNSADRSISVVGHINRRVKTQILELLDSSNPQLLYMDSGGGDYGAAFEIALAIKARHLHLIVKRCVSACADPIFLFATTKQILSGGYVAIHGSPAAKTDAELEQSLTTIGSTREIDLHDGKVYLRQLAGYWRGLYETNGFSVELQRAYIDFERRQVEYLKHSVGRKDDDKSCPRAHILWAPTMQAWEQIGLSGVTSYFYPDEEYREKLIAPDEKELYGKVWMLFSDKAGIDALCQGFINR